MSELDLNAYIFLHKSWCEHISVYFLSLFAEESDTAAPTKHSEGKAAANVYCLIAQQTMKTRKDDFKNEICSTCVSEY